MNKKRKRRILGIIRLFLTIIFILLFIYFIIIGIKTVSKKEKNEANNTNETTEKNEIESKYTKEEQSKLEKLNYINEKIDYFKMENIDRYIEYKEKNNDLNNEKIVLYVNIGIDKDFYSNIYTSPNQNTNTILVNKYYAIDSTFEPKDLVNIDSKYRTRNDAQMTKEATEAFNKLASDAQKEGYTILAMSTYRSYSRQKTIYNNYVSYDGVKKADTYSARPGHSEHHTGLAVDVKNKDKVYTKFGETEEFIWMKENAHKYGFILRYTTENEFITGYKNEPWHYRYVGIEIATQMKKENISSYEEYYFMYLDK